MLYEVITLLGRRHIPLDEVVGDPGRSRLDAAEALGDGRQRLAHVKKGVGLLFGQSYNFV